MNRQQEVVEWRNATVANLIIRWFFTGAARYWFVTVPVVGWLVFAPLAGVLLAFGCGYVQWQLRLRQRARLAELYEQAGGEFLYCQIQDYTAAWPTTARSVGLTQRVGAEPLGVIRAAHRHLASVKHQLDGDAFGREDNRVPTLVGIGPTALGITHNVKLLAGQTVDDYVRVASALAEVWQVESVRVQRGEPGHVSLTPVTLDPLAEVIELLPDCLRPATDLDFVPLGMTEDGGIWSMALDQTSTVFGGVPGSGKSVAINVLLANVAHRDDIAIIAADLKGGLEMADWAPRCAATAFDQQTALEVFYKLLSLHKQRMEMLRGYGVASMSRLGYSAEHPLYLVVIDEAAELFAPEGSSKEAKALASELVVMVSRIVRLCRATGIVVVLATQKPTSDSVPTVIRDNSPGKAAWRCTTPEQAVATLGEAARSAEFSPTDIKIGEKGVAVAADADGVLRRVRCFYISETTRRAVVAATRHLARPLGSEVFTAPVYNEPDEDDDVLLPPRRRPYAYTGLPDGVIGCDRSGGPLDLIREQA